MQNQHQVAAVGYAGLGVLVIVITFAAGLVPSSRRGAIWELAVGAIFVLIFAALIWRGWWPLALLLVFSNLWRAFTYAMDGLGKHVELAPFSVSDIQARPIAFVNAGLMAVIVILLARAGWAGWSDWRAARRRDA
ncbi:MAG: hypothetical protein HY260_18530 [Chloroflexi bacterium]|nr:hypothetical protein [Chloroflexota bacterium]